MKWTIILLFYFSTTRAQTSRQKQNVAGDRNIPDQPNDFQMANVAPGEVTVQWLPARFAETYRIRTQNTRTGLTRIFNNASSPFVIGDLEFAETYNVTVQSVGNFSDSNYVPSISIDIPYPPVGQVTGIEVDQISTASFRVRWLPMPFAISYNVIVSDFRGKTRKIQFVRRIQCMVRFLQPGTTYNVTVEAINVAGRAVTSEEYRTVTTVRLIPDQPNDFQIVNVSPEEVRVQWFPARFAVTYRVSIQHTRTGLTRIFNNASSPFVIGDLEFRESYDVTVQSVGKYFDSDYVQPISVDIPYPSANQVTGIVVDQVSTASFRVRWQPTPFAIGYTVVVSEFGGRTRKIQFIRRIQYRVRNLRPASVYNVTVEAISNTGTPVASDNFRTVTTARGSTPRPGRTTSTVEPDDDDIISDIVAFIVSLLSNVPDSLVNLGNTSDPFPKDESMFTDSLEERLTMLRDEIRKTFTRDERTSLIVPKIALSQPRFDFGGQTAQLQSLFSLGQELKILARMNGSGSDLIADSIANRLTLTLTELVTINSDLSGIDARTEIREFLFPFVNHELEDFIAIGLTDEIIFVNPSLSTDVPLTIFIRKQTLSSNGFTVTWGRYKNIHRYRIQVNEVIGSGETNTIIDGIAPRQSHTLTNLKPSTNYSIIVRPVDGDDEVISGIVGRISTRTLDEAESSFNVNITEVGYNDVTLTWDRFPSRVLNLVFRIRLEGDLVNHQQFSVNRVHRSIRFTSLLPGTTYSITATANSQTFFNTDITTRSGVPAVVTVPPESNSLSPPSGLRLVAVGRNTISVEWLQARIRNLPQSTIRYNVRLYTANTQRLRSIKRFIGTTQWTFRTPLTTPLYDVTVSTYNLLTRKESRQSPRLRVDIRNASKKR